jgi:plastocyanin
MRILRIPFDVFRRFVMRNTLLNTVVAASLWLGFSIPAHGIADDDAASGSIKGKIKAAGVKDVEHVLVYVEKAPGEYKPPADQAEIDQEKLTFIPRVLPILKGTKVTFKNSDPVLHNVFWQKSRDGSYPAQNLGSWGKGATKEFTFDKEGSVVLLCNVHPDMEGHVVVLQNPFFVMADEDGSYEIKGVPAGEYSVKAWYPNPKKLKAESKKATVKADEATKLDFSLGRK